MVDTANMTIKTDDRDVERAIKNLNKLGKVAISTETDLNKLASTKLTSSMAGLSKALAKSSSWNEKMSASLRKVIDRVNPTNTAVAKTKTLLSELNTQWKQGSVTMAQYSGAQELLHKELANTVSSLHKVAKGAEETAPKIVKMSAALRKAVDNSHPLNSSVKKTKQLLMELDTQFRQGSVSTKEYAAAQEQLHKDLAKTASKLYDVDKASTAAVHGMNKTHTAAARTRVSLGMLSHTAAELRAIFAAYVGFQGVAQLADISNEAINVTNKLKVVTNSATELDNTFNKLAMTAEDSWTSLDTSATLFQRMSIATSDLGISQDELLRITGLINKSFQLSGATAAESTGAIRQLTQAFNGNMLRGEEFNSVTEQAPIILKAIEKQTGKTGLELRKFAETGGITSQTLINAFRDFGGEIDRLFGKTEKTIENRFVDMRREFVMWARDNQNLTRTLNLAMDALDELAALSRVVVDRITGLVVSFDDLSMAVGNLAMSYPTLLKVWVKFNNSMNDSESIISNLAQGLWNLASPLDMIENSVSKLTSMLNKADDRENASIETLKEIILVKSKIDLTTEAVKKGGREGKIASFKLQKLKEELAELQKVYQAIEADIGRTTKSFEDQNESLDKLIAQRAEFFALEKALNKEYTEVYENIDQIVSVIDAETEAYKKGQDAVDEYNRQLAIETEVQSKVSKLKFKNGSVTEAMVAKIRQSVVANMDAKKSLEDLAAAQEKATKQASEDLDVLIDSNAELFGLSKEAKEENKKAVEEMAKAAEEAKDRIDELADSFLNKLDPSREKIAALEEDLAGVGAALSKGLISQTDAEGFAEEILQDIDRVKNGLPTIGETAEMVGDVFKDAVGEMSDSLGGFSDVVGELAGMLGKDLVGGLKGLSGLATSFFTTANFNQGAFDLATGQGKGGAGANAVATAGGFGAGMLSAGNAVLPMFAASAASYLANSFIENVSSGNWNDALDDALPFFQLGRGLSALGINIGGKPSDKTQTSQLQLGTGQVTQGGFLSGSKFSETGREIADTATVLLGQVASQLAAKLGTDLAGELEFIVGERDGIRVNFNGEQLFKSNSVTESLTFATEYLLELGNQTSSVYAELANDGEGLGESFVRLDGQLMAVKSVTEGLGLGFELAGDAGVRLADEMVRAAGGVDALVQSATIYYNKFFTEEEKFQDLVSGLESSFSELNLSVPNTREAFRELVDSADAATVAMLMNLVPSLDLYLSSLEGWDSEVTRLYEDILGRAPDAAGLEFYLNQLKSGQMTIDDVANSLSNSTEALVNSWIAQASTVNTNNSAKEFTDSLGITGDATGTMQGLDLLEEITSGVDRGIVLITDDMIEAEKAFDALSETASDFLADLSLESQLAGLTGKDKDIFLLEKWKEDTLQQIQDYEDQGISVVGGASNVQNIFDIRMSEIEDRYAEVTETVVDSIDKESDALITLDMARSSVITSYEREASELENFMSRMGNAAEALRSHADSLLVSDLSPLSPNSKYQAARTQFTELANRAKQGDIDAMEALPGVSDMFLKQSREFQGSAGSYAQDFDLVRSTELFAANLADQQRNEKERQLDYLKAQVDGIVEVKEEVMSLKEAIDMLTRVQQDTAQETIGILTESKDSLGILSSNSEVNAA